MSLSRAEFSREFKGLRARYPQFQMPEPSYVEGAYYEELKGFTRDIVHRAMNQAVQKSPGYFPPLGVIKAICLDLQAGDFEKPPWEKKIKFAPFPHTCAPKGTKVVNGVAFRMLTAFAVYEAGHIVCPGERFKLRCPNCGIEQAPFLNPFFRKLIKDYPNETEGWNPWHKGYMLCDPCNKQLEHDWIPVQNVDEPRFSYIHVSRLKPKVEARAL